MQISRLHTSFRLEFKSGKGTRFNFLTSVVEAELCEPLLVDGEEPSAHDGVGVRGPGVLLLPALLDWDLVPLEGHLPVHEALEVTVDEGVPEGRVVDRVNHRAHDHLGTEIRGKMHLRSYESCEWSVFAIRLFRVFFRRMHFLREKKKRKLTLGLSVTR